MDCLKDYNIIALKYSITKIILGDTCEGMDSLAEDEEEVLLKEAIALSLEGAEEDDQDEECS